MWTCAHDFQSFSVSYNVMLSQSLIAIRTVLIMHVPTHDPTLAGLGWRTVGDSKFDLLFDELFVSPLDSQI